jgi:hypothetical protein
MNVSAVYAAMSEDDLLIVASDFESLADDATKDAFRNEFRRRGLTDFDVEEYIKRRDTDRDPIRGDVIYASLLGRLAAYIIDLITMKALLVIGLVLAATIFTAFGRTFPYSTFDSRLTGMALFMMYMILAQLLTQNTVGKYIVRIQVINVDPDGVRPSAGRIVLRETLGRLISSLLFGAGYWTCKRPQNQAWSDQMANTFVVKRDVDRRIWAAMIFGACLSTALLFAVWSTTL